MKGLTEEQLDHYKNKGYVSPVNALTSSEAKEIREEIIERGGADIYPEE